MRPIALAAICGLASCNQIPAPSDSDQAVDMSGAMTMTPGIYEASGDMKIIDIPGLDQLRVGAESRSDEKGVGIDDQI